MSHVGDFQPGSGRPTLGPRVAEDDGVSEEDVAEDAGARFNTVPKTDPKTVSQKPFKIKD